LYAVLSKASVILLEENYWLQILQ